MLLPQLGTPCATATLGRYLFTLGIWGSNFRWFERSLLARCWSVVHCDGSLNAQRALHPNGQRPLLRPAHPTGPTHVSSTLTRWTLGACCLCPPSRTRVLCMCRECSPGPPLIGWPVRPCSNYIQLEILGPQRTGWATLGDLRGGSRGKVESPAAAAPAHHSGTPVCLPTSTGMGAPLCFCLS